MVADIRQWSDWSTAQPVSIQYLNSAQKLSLRRSFQTKLYGYWSSISPVLRGLILGILVGCLLLAIALALWLTKPTSGMKVTSVTTTVTTTTATSTTTTTTITTTSVTTTTTTVTTATSTSSTTTTATVTFLPTGIYALTISTCATWNQIGITVAGNTNGTLGSDLGSLSAPVGIFVDNNDTLVVADRDNNRVMKYYPNSTVGIITAGNQTLGNDPNELSGPKGVAIDQTGALIVADSDNYRIQKFLPGSLIGTTLFANTSSTPLGQIRDLHIDVNNNIYVIDSDNNQAVKFTPYSTAETILAGDGTIGSGNNQLFTPFGNCIDENNTLYVADTGNNRVMKYLPGSTVGTIVAGINGSLGPAANQLDSPDAVIVDNNGYIYIADNGNNRIMKWTTDYTAGGVCIVGCTGTSGTGNDQLSNPRNLKFDQYGNLYVSDQGNNRIQKFMIISSSWCSRSG